MRALVRPPSSRLAEGLVTHIERTSIDLDLAGRQWHAYCDRLADAGFQIVTVPKADELPDSVFIEDAAVMFDNLAIIANPSAPSRKRETEAVEATLADLGIESKAIQDPGTLDGGDVLKVGKTVYVGRSQRTNTEGIRQLGEILAPRGFTVVPVPITKVLHLKSAVTALPDGTVIGYPDDVDEPELFPKFLPLPEHGGEVVVLSADSVLMAQSAPRSIRLVECLGYQVKTVDISEYEKLEGCVTCLSIRIRR